MTNLQVPTAIRVLHPQEIEVFYVIPAIRRLFTLHMKQLGLPQKQIAQILGVRESTISQYLTNKRAASISFGVEVEHDIKTAASSLKSPFDAIRETQHLLRKILSSGELCRIHKQISTLPENCNIRVMGCAA